MLGKYLNMMLKFFLKKYKFFILIYKMLVFKEIFGEKNLLLWMLDLNCFVYIFKFKKKRINNV